MLRVVFMGSPEFAVPSLQLVHRAHQVVAVVTKPDMPAGRGKQLAPPPVKRAALELGLAVIQPPSVRTPEFLAALHALKADVAVVVAYGKILPQTVLDVFPLGCINVHGSLLPAYRGAAPIQWAVIDGHATTGVSIMRLDAGMDTGPVFRTREMAIGASETSGELAVRMATLGAHELVDVLAGLASATPPTPVPQPAQGSIARMLNKQDGRIDFACNAHKVASRICGVDPWPGAVATLGAADGAIDVKLFGATVAVEGATAMPGTIEVVSSEGVRIACGEGGAVWVRELQLAGRKRVAASQLAAGRTLAPGDRFRSEPV